MKHTFQVSLWLSGIVLVMALIGLGMNVPSIARADAPPPGYKLVWADEFDYQGLPDPKKWDYEEGFVRNKELQYYTRGRLENARVENGCLVIEGRKEHFETVRIDPKKPGVPGRRETAEYTAASLITLEKAGWQYGRIEVRAKLPQGKGVWPAIWTLGTNIRKVGWPACGEIDIMEYVGHTPDKVHATVHWGKDGKRHASQGKNLSVTAPWNDFHVYAVEWTADAMDFYFDKTCYHRYELKKADQGDANPFRMPHYLLVNLALGGSWGGKMDDSVLPQKFVVDYVRVYQKTQAEK